MAGIGLFGSSIPEGHGGTEMGLLTMAVLTEELSSVSLVAGSLITRSEILTRALLAGGTDEQRQHWLPRIASGELLVGVAVTEPDIDPTWPRSAARRSRGEHDGKQGWFIEGPKAWSTFAGRAQHPRSACPHGCDVRRQPRPLPVHRPEGPLRRAPLRAHAAGRRTITGTANPTPGYRGMHSFTLAIDHYFVPEENLVGGEEGLGKGFYLQMGGFEAGRLQTGARATGVSQASIEKACTYTSDRKQFGPLADYQLTQYKIGRMATHAAAGRHLTYAAAQAMERDEQARASSAPSTKPGAGTLAAAMCKLFASDVAIWVSQEGCYFTAAGGTRRKTRLLASPWTRWSCRYSRA